MIRSSSIRKPPRWDLAAERYSAAVDPVRDDARVPACCRNGADDKSDPALTNDELVIDAEKFDPSVRDGLVEFFRKALHREPAQRFDNADEMRRGRGRQVFKEAEKRKITTAAGEEVELRVSLEQADLRRRSRPWASPPVPATPWSGPTVITVRDLLDFPIGDIHLMRGVGNQTRQEIIRFVGELRERFPDIRRIDEAAAHRRSPRPHRPSNRLASSYRRRPKSEEGSRMEHPMPCWD